MNIKLKIQDLADAGKPLFPEISDAGLEEGILESVAILQSGMVSGEPSLWVNVRLKTGRYVCAQLSGAMLEMIAGALRGAKQRWGYRG